jgi:hypothetical protein
MFEVDVFVVVNVVAPKPSVEAVAAIFGEEVATPENSNQMHAKTSAPKLPELAVKVGADSLAEQFALNSTSPVFDSVELFNADVYPAGTALTVPAPAPMRMMRARKFPAVVGEPNAAGESVDDEPDATATAVC